MMLSFLVFLSAFSAPFVTSRKLLDFNGSRPSVCNGVPGCDAGLPLELANFQGKHACPRGVQIANPPDYESLRDIVVSFPHVKAAGAGHNWNPTMFCPSSTNDRAAVGLVMTNITSIRRFNTSDPDFPIQIDEDEMTAWSLAGVTQRALLNYLASRGYSLLAYSWYIDQTIGGAVSTGTHGSSLRFGSLSSQVLALEVMLANGTVTTVTADSDPHLFRAFRVSVGRLGVILRVKLRITKATRIQRALTETNVTAFDVQLEQFQAALRAAIASGNATAVSEVLLQLDETQIFVFFPSQKVWRIDYEHDQGPDIETLDTELLSLGPAAIPPKIQAFSGPESDQPEVDPAAVDEQALDSTPIMDGANSSYVRPQQAPRGNVTSTPAIDTAPLFWSTFFEISLRPTAEPGIFSRRDAFLSMSEDAAITTSLTNPYDQYEVSFPLIYAADCWKNATKAIYSAEQLWTGFRSPALIRFVADEDAYLSIASGGPRMFVNIEDYLTYATGTPNRQFQRVMEIFTQCPYARLHWGKSGWDNTTGGWNGPGKFQGAKEFDKWCDFGCAAKTLDPTGKFVGAASYVWEWKASVRSSALGNASTGGAAPNGTDSSVAAFDGSGGQAEAAESSAARDLDVSVCCGPDGFRHDICECVA